MLANWPPTVVGPEGLNCLEAKAVPSRRWPLLCTRLPEWLAVILVPGLPPTMLILVSLKITKMERVEEIFNGGTFCGDARLVLERDSTVDLAGLALFHKRRS